MNNDLIFAARKGNIENVERRKIIAKKMGTY